ncbi:4'-phosphopantetheinyl transferase superfamily protein [Lachnospiraceae bacterium ZAX-1]
MLNIYYLELKSTVFTNNDKNLLHYVSKQRSEKVLRYRFDIDRLLSLYGELLTRMTLSQIIGTSTSNLDIHTDSNRKPYLHDFRDYHFNLSHTRNCILLCISNNCSVGADIEKISNPPYEISNNCFHPKEKEFIDSGIPQEKAKRFFEIWTKKESYLKKCGTGLTTNLTKINTLSLPVYYQMYHYGNYISAICSDINHTGFRSEVSQLDIIKYYNP